MRTTLIVCDKCKHAIPSPTANAESVHVVVHCGAGAAIQTKDGARVERFIADLCDECATEMFGFAIELAPQRADKKAKPNPISPETAVALAEAYR